LFEALPNRVMSLGDLVGLAFRCFRSNLGAYVKVLGWPAACASLASRLALLSVQDWTRIASSSQLAFEPFLVRMLLAFVCLIFWFVSTWKLSVGACALVRYILSMESDLKTSLDVMRGRSVPVLVAYNLALLPPLLAVAAWIGLSVAGMLILPNKEPWHFLAGGFFFGLIGFGLTVSIALTSLYGSLLVSVTALEPLKMKQCLLRTWEFVRARPLRGGSFTCLIVIAVTALCVAIAAPLDILTVFEAFTRAKMHLMTESPIYLQILQTFVDMILNIVSFAIMTTGYGLFYRDLRLRLEGDDLVKRLRSIESSR
jgi:hypothetical protein